MSREKTRGLFSYFPAVILLLALFPLQLRAADTPAPQTLHVAVASNFLFPLKQLAKKFRQETKIDLIISSGSTGTLYAQISNGAPFDVFLAADENRPQLLVDKGFAVKDSLITYAHGQIILWGNDKQLLTPKETRQCLSNLEHSGRLAIANPQIAPYGKAAMESLQNLSLWKKIKPRTVYGNNIAHTFLLVHTGNVDFGIVALSEYLRMGQQRPGCIWPISDQYHSPLEQQAVILKRTTKNTIARIFMTFLTNEETRKTLKDLGYGKR
ncbi:MAG: molybdate ABC transporter substrate-binding protein [Emcibacter sp.]|nr:molybdate ABC transporter substrate-binding protein [Emcibacter sp.]